MAKKTLEEWAEEISNVMHYNRDIDHKDLKIAIFIRLMQIKDQLKIEFQDDVIAVSDLSHFDNTDFGKGSN